MEQYLLIAGVPIGSWILFGLGLIGIWLIIRYPHTDWVKKFFDLSHWFNEFYKTRPKRNEDQRMKDLDFHPRVKDGTSQKLRKVAHLLSRRDKTISINLGQRLCDYLNRPEIKEVMLEVQTEDQLAIKLRQSVNEFLDLHRLIRNGDVRAKVIDLNLDRHYRLRLKENIWIVDRE